MRRRYRNSSRGAKEAGQNIFVSMSDIFVGMLFLFLIFMVFFALEMGKEGADCGSTAEECQKSVDGMNIELSALRKQVKDLGKMLGTEGQSFSNVIGEKNIQIVSRDYQIKILEKKIAEADGKIIILIGKLKGVEKDLENGKIAWETCKKTSETCGANLEKCRVANTDCKKAMKGCQKNCPIEAPPQPRPPIKPSDPVAESYSRACKAAVLALNEIASEGSGLLRSDTDCRLTGGFPDSSGWFGAKRSTLKIKGKKDLRRLVPTIEKELKCRIRRADQERDPECYEVDGSTGKVSGQHLIRSFVFEGHTQIEPIRQTDSSVQDSGGQRNMSLSAERAVTVWRFLLEENKDFTNYLNVDCEPLFGVAGYGGTRAKVDPETSSADRKQNRRVEIRLEFDPSSDTKDYRGACNK